MLQYLKFTIAVFLIAAVLLTGCSKDDTTGPNLAPTGPRLTNISGGLSIPEGSQISASDLTVRTAFDNDRPESDGSFDVKVPITDQNQLLMAVGQNDQPILLAIADSSLSGDVEISARSTAKALVLMNPIFMMTDAEQRRLVLRWASEHPDFEQLVGHIEALLVNDAEHTLDFTRHPSIFKEAVQIGLDLLEDNSPVLAPKQIDEEPWIEDAGGPAVTLYNPRCIFYGARVSERPSGTDKGTYLIHAKEKLWKYQFAWPPVTWEDPTTTTLELGNGQFNLLMSKGFDMSDGIGGLFNWSTANGRASLCNAGKSVLLTVDLILGIGGFNVGWQDLRLTVPVKTASDIAQYMHSGDSWGLAKTFVSLLLANIDNVCYWLWQNAATDATRAFMTAAHGILKNVAAIVKIFFTAEMGLNKAVPFFYDLATAPPTMNFQITKEDGVLTENEQNLAPNPPIITSGTSFAESGDACQYTTYTSDPDGDRVQYRFHFGDGTSSSWSSLKTSGDSYSLGHIFSSDGVYPVVVEARDARGGVSLPSNQWETHIVPQGYRLFDNFDSYDVGGHPSDPPWETLWEDPSYLNITADWRYGSSGKACAFYDYDEDIGESDGAFASIRASVTHANRADLEFVWSVEDKYDYFGVRAWQEWNWDYMGYYVLFKDGALMYADGSNFVTIQSIEAKTWYRMKLSYDISSGTFDIYVNDVLKAQDVSFYGNPGSLNILQVDAFSDAGCKVGYIDNVALSDGPTLGLGTAAIGKPNSYSYLLDRP